MQLGHIHYASFHHIRFVFGIFSNCSIYHLIRFGSSFFSFQLSCYLLSIFFLQIGDSSSFTNRKISKRKVDIILLGCIYSIFLVFMFSLWYTLFVRFFGSRHDMLQFRRFSWVWLVCYKDVTVTGEPKNQKGNVANQICLLLLALVVYIFNQNWHTNQNISFFCELLRE